MNITQYSAPHQPQEFQSSATPPFIQGNSGDGQEQAPASALLDLQSRDNGENDSKFDIEIPEKSGEQYIKIDTSTSNSELGRDSAVDSGKDELASQEATMARQKRQSDLSKQRLKYYFEPDPEVEDERNGEEEVEGGAAERLKALGKVVGSEHDQKQLQVCDWVTQPCPGVIDETIKLNRKRLDRIR